MYDGASPSLYVSRQLELDALCDGQPVQARSGNGCLMWSCMAPTRQIRQNQAATIFQKPRSS